MTEEEFMQEITKKQKLLSKIKKVAEKIYVELHGETRLGLECELKNDKIIYSIYTDRNHRSISYEGSICIRRLCQDFEEKNDEEIHNAIIQLIYNDFIEKADYNWFTK